MKIQFAKNFADIASVENFLEAWREFVKGKRGKRDVQEFSLHLIDNLFLLHDDLVYHTYRHGGYQAFNISDPKPRNIHKASVRDRLVHHAIYRVLYPFFDKAFIADSFSCRKEKGTHRALNRFRIFAYKVSKNNTRTCWVLKCDIRKFFANINHTILMRILRSYIRDGEIIELLQEIISSFSSMRPGAGPPSHSFGWAGLPLGNLTSQLLVNVYMNEFDQFVKHGLKARYYLRYADDFIFLSKDRVWLEQNTLLIREFLREKLQLTLHPDKVFIKTLASGVDFLGWVHFPDHRVLRTSTRRRMMKKIMASHTPETFNSYFGLLAHGNTRKLHTDVSAMLHDEEKLRYDRSQ
ncbi:MAG: group II intron reverse transcriptase domain-containing protein [Candidatus Liptonbacteria bacterium]|nr:group II intron reverse transcriptase domain-containing protein [Candidatus Liptonbacteria bacterium]